MRTKIYIWIFAFVVFLFLINPKNPYLVYDSISSNYKITSESAEVIKSDEKLNNLFKIDTKIMSTEKGINKGSDIILNYFIITNLENVKSFNDRSLYDNYFKELVIENNNGQTYYLKFYIKKCNQEKIICRVYLKNSDIIYKTIYFEVEK